MSSLVYSHVTMYSHASDISLLSQGLGFLGFLYEVFAGGITAYIPLNPLPKTDTNM